MSDQPHTPGFDGPEGTEWPGGRIARPGEITQWAVHDVATGDVIEMPEAKARETVETNRARFQVVSRTVTPWRVVE